MGLAVPLLGVPGSSPALTAMVREPRSGTTVVRFPVVPR